MTDTTELAQGLKAAANNTGADEWQAKKIGGGFYVIRKGSYSSQCGYRTYQPIAEIDHKSTRDYVAIASPANVLALVEALEKEQRYTEELREWNAGLAQESCERQQRISELLQGKVGSALLERENHHVEVVGKLTKVITELESEVEKWRQEAEAWEQVAEKQLATAIELESRTVKLPDLRQIVSGDRYVWSDGVYNYSQDVKVVLAAAGIKWEAE